MIPVLAVLVFFSLNSIAQSQTPPPLDAELSGRVYNEWRRPLGGILVTLKPTAYAYGTQDYPVVSNPNGRFDIKQIKRYVYSSGSAPKYVNYYIFVSVPGYEE